jgi:peptidoglycan/LPS O-acetylase OafA/YrhL
LLVTLVHRRWPLPDGSLANAWLAVDFFFMLSGFVIGYAYDQRLRSGSLSFLRFVQVRFIRLGPLLVVGALLGVIVLALKTGDLSVFAYWLPASVPLPIPGMVEPFQVNGPSWSLFWELAANFAFALVAVWLTTRRLVLALAASSVLALGLMIFARYGSVGVFWGSMIAGPVRVGAPFLGGLLLYRLWAAGKLPKIPAPFWLVAVALAAVLANPFTHTAYVPFCVFVAFPLLIVAGCSQDDREPSWAVRFGAEVSYPIYIIHYPLLDLSEWAFGPDPSLPRVAAELVTLCAISIFLARRFDAPMRRWMGERLSRAYAPR